MDIGDVRFWNVLMTIKDENGPELIIWGRLRTGCQSKLVTNNDL